MKKLNEELDHIPIIIKIILCVVMTAIIALMNLLFVGVAHALTPVEANFNYTQNGQTVSYNIKPDGGTTGFIYENEFYGQTISHSAYKHYLPASGNIGEITTTNINGYFQNPCANGEDISYTMKINFYKQPSDENTMAWVRVTNGIDGCTGYFEVINGVYTYNNVCNLKAGDVPKFSLYFNESSRGQTYYRVGIPINFSYTCQIGNQAVIDSNNANTNKIVNSIADNINNVTNSIQESIINSYKHCETINNQNIEINEKYLRTNGVVVDGSSAWGITKYYDLEKGTMTVKTEYDNDFVAACYYTEDKTLISCIGLNTLEENTTLTPPSNAKWFRSTILITQNKPQFKYCQNNTDAIIENQNQNTDRMIDKMILFHEADEEEWEEEKGLLQSILSAIGGIFSSSIDDPSNTLNGFNNSIATDNTISSLLLLPVRLYQNVLNNINGSCNSFNLGSLYNHQLTMTCIQPQSFLGSALYGVIDVIISGFFILHIRKKFVDIFNHLTSLRTGGNELE